MQMQMTMAGCEEQRCIMRMKKKKYVPAVRQWPESYTRTAEMGALSFLIKRSG
jgi:hypothetical protein